MTRFLPADAGGGADGGRLAATGWTSGADAGAAATGAAATAGAGAAGAAAAALLGSIMIPMILSDTPAPLSFTRSAGASFIALFALCRLLMMRDSGSPAFTEAITSSTGDPAAGFGAVL